MTYVYLCPQCGQYEATQRITEDAYTQCELCQSPVKRVPQLTPVHLHGSGFFATDDKKARKPL